MSNRTKINVKRLLFYWLTSVLLATGLYYLLWVAMPNHIVFGALYRMFVYHWQHPIQYILIPCFFYGIIATCFAELFSGRKFLGQVFLTLLIILLTVFISSPFGGMLWHYHDMQAGYFPSNWVGTMIAKGFSWGLELGWLIVGLSMPYNFLGAVICYFLTKKGSELFRTSGYPEK